MNMEKIIYPIGTKLYLSQRTGDYYVDMVRRPYTVVGYSKGKLLIQQAKCSFPTPCYYDTLPTSIEEDPEGEVLELSWAPKKGIWQIDKYHTGYPEFAFFGEWDFKPYLN